jgi:hypothetical protein
MAKGSGGGNRSMREALKEAEELGCEVKLLRRTGEYMISHPDFERRLRINGRRKDTPRVVNAMLDKLAKERTT